MIDESDNYEKMHNAGSGQTSSLENMLSYTMGQSHRSIAIKEDTDRLCPADQMMICSDDIRIKNKVF